MSKRANGRSTVVALVGVGLPSHPRVMRIPKGKLRGEALGCWLAATLYSRAEELDGWCPTEYLEPLSSPEGRARLVAVGLFVAEDRDGVAGVIVVKYEEFNETKAQIDVRLTRDRRRKRAGIQTDSDRIPDGFQKLPTPISGNGDGDGEGDASTGESREGRPATVAPLPIPLAAVGGNFGMEGHFWAEGVTAFTRVPCSPPSPFEHAELVKATRHTALRGQALNEWYREQGRAFAEATAALRTWWPITARKFLQWLTDGSKSAAELEAARGYAGVRGKRGVQQEISEDIVRGKEF